MTECYIALGGNLGNVAETFSRALQMLDEELGVMVGKVSRSFHTVSVGDVAGGDFLNAAVEIRTELSPLALLDLLQAIEDKLGRTRDVRWGPRTLDIDVLFYGSQTIATDRLRVPHSGSWYRRFVLDPLAEIAPDFVHPLLGTPLRALRERLLDRPLSVGIAAATNAESQRLEQIVREFPDVTALTGEFGTVYSTAFSQTALVICLAGPLVYVRHPMNDRVSVCATEGESVESFVRNVLRAALGA